MQLRNERRIVKKRGSTIIWPQRPVQWRYSGQAWQELESMSSSSRQDRNVSVVDSPDLIFLALLRQESSSVLGGFVCLKKNPSFFCNLDNHWLLLWNPGKSVLTFTRKIFILTSQWFSQALPTHHLYFGRLFLGPSANQPPSWSQPLCKQLASETFGVQGNPGPHPACL